MRARGNRIGRSPTILPYMDLHKRAKFTENFSASDGCWEWEAAKDSDGYGSFYLRPGVRVGAHRIAYALWHKLEPGTAHVLHTCDNPGCVNPRHLWLGDAAANAADKVQKGRARGKFSNRGSNEPWAPVQKGATQNG